MRRIKPIAVALCTIPVVYLASCSKTAPQNTPLLSQVTFTMANGQVYTFGVKELTNGVPSAMTDEQHGITVKFASAQTPNGAYYLTGITVSNNSVLVSTVTITDTVNTENNAAYPKYIQSQTTDTTLSYNLGNMGYNLGAYPVYSYGSNPSTPVNYYVGTALGFKDSLGTATTGVYDTSMKWLYAINEANVHEGDYYYANADDALYMWVVECALGYSHCSFGDIATYLSRYQWGVAITEEFKYVDDSVSNNYTYTYATDNTNYTVTQSKVTDSKGNVCSATFQYQ